MILWKGLGKGGVLSDGEVLSFRELETPGYCALEILDLHLFCHCKLFQSNLNDVQGSASSMTKVSSLSFRSGQCGACLQKAFWDFYVCHRASLFSPGSDVFLVNAKLSLSCQVPSIFLCILHNLQLKSSGVRS